ncbi:MAG: hypothetical protein ABIH20_06245 [Candidatus Diapherotrites archaeon]
MELEISFALARFWGLFYIIFSLLFIVTQQLGKTIEMTDDKKFVIATGYSTLLMGLGTVAIHNIWVWDWPVAITILGWGTVMKGIHKIGFPESIHEKAQMFKNKQFFSTLFLLLLGIWLSWIGFGF